VSHRSGEGRETLPRAAARGYDEPPLFQTHFPTLPPPQRGKVRDIYDFGKQLLIVATDRISVFDVVLPTGISGKGKILTQLSCFWFERTRDLIPNHLLTTDPGDYPEACRPYGDVLDGRSMLVQKVQPLPVECIARGYLAGSAWEEYRRTGRIGDLALPPGLVEAARLDPPLFTPTTKAPQGQHDEAMTFATLQATVGPQLAGHLQTLSIALYTRGQDLAEPRGLILADTKFEFGVLGDELLLIDELFTPDSSRFWPQDGYQPGRPPPSFDKQFVRDYVTTLGWNRQPPGPELPAEIVRKTRERYLEAYRRLVGAEPHGV